MSLRTLATEVGVSAGFLSQLERDLADPSLDTLRRLASSLGLPLFDLFQSPGDGSPAVVRRENRVAIASPAGGISYTRLSPGSGRLEMLEGTLEPGGSSSEEPWSHPSEECITVLSGQLVVEVDGRANRLMRGDSCYFDSRLPHRYLNPSSRQTRFLLAVTPPSY
jgi:quercetin dioxygenase-like cupin family protein